MKRYIIGICLAFIPAITLLAQEEGITFLKDGKLEVNTVFNPDSLKQDTLPKLSKRELRRLHVAKTKSPL